MITSKLEVLVDFGPTPDQQDVNRTLNHLKSQDHVKQAIYQDGAVMVETTLPSSVVLDMVTKTSGKRAVLQGFGDTQSAVAMISSQSTSEYVLGVVRFTQTESALIADGSVDGLTPGPHGLHVHETGDLSLGCSSIGSHYNPLDAPHGAPTDPPKNRHAGDLGNIYADEQGRARFRIVDSVLQINEILGRSIAVTERSDDLGRGSSQLSKINGDSGTPIACGIIARSAGIFQNPKRICACDGVVVWDERDRPLAGKGRRQCCQKEETGVKVCCKAIYQDGAVMVETTLPSSVVLDMVTKTSGKRAVLQGFGDTQSAVAMISSQSTSEYVLGVVRFTQTETALIADGSVDGLTPGPHGLHVHETGDLSLGCSSIGSHYNPLDAPHGAPTDPPKNRHAGDLGNIYADEQGRARFRIVDSVLQINEILGRSIAVTERSDDLGRGSSQLSKINGDSGTPIACGIIARSAGIFQNPKRICACDGVVVWDERDRPLAGKGRRQCCQKEETGVKVCCKV